MRGSDGRSEGPPCVHVSHAWRDRLEVLLYAMLAEISRPGKHGEGSVRVVVHDGVIQYAEQIFRTRVQ